MQYQDRSSEFLDERSLHEANLLAVVETLLSESGLHQTRMSLRGYFETHEIVNKKPNVQRFFMNKFFQLLLLAIDANTIEQRFCLITDGTVDDWLSLFRKKILPFLREYLNG